MTDPEIWETVVHFVTVPQNEGIVVDPDWSRLQNLGRFGWGIHPFPTEFSRPAQLTGDHEP